MVSTDIASLLGMLQGDYKEWMYSILGMVQVKELRDDIARLGEIIPKAVQVNWAWEFLQEV